MAGKKNQGGSGDDLFGEFEDSFFKSGEDDSFWDDDTVVAYEESMAVSKAELAKRAAAEAAAAAEGEGEGEAPADAPDEAGAAGPTDVTVSQPR